MNMGQFAGGNATAIVKTSLMSLTTMMATATTGMEVHLNRTQDYYGIPVPFWYFLVASVVLSFVGAFWALFTDIIKGKGSVLGKVLVAVSVGWVFSFIILPLHEPEASGLVMALTSLVGSFAGTIFLFLTARLFGDAELQDEVLKIIKEQLLSTIRGLAKIATTLNPWSSNK